MIYLLMFVISLSLLWIALNSRGRVHKFCLVLSAFLPCLLAGLRGETVGTDMRVYIIRHFEAALRSNNFINYMNLIWVNDYLYLVINYFVSRFTDQLWIELFLQQALVIIPIYIALFRIFDNKHSVFWGITLYFLFMYNSTLNEARQSIALAFEILGFSYLGKNKKGVISCFIIGILFHNTAILTAIPFFLFWIYNSSNFSSKFKFLISGSLCLGCSLLVYFLKFFLPILANSNLEVMRRISGYTRYLRTEIDISKSGIALCLVCLVFSFIWKQKTKKFCYDKNYFPTLALIGVILFQTGSMIEFSQRASYYFLYPVVFIAMPYICAKPLATRGGVLHPQRWLFCFFVIWWFLNIVIWNAHETIPYIFFFS